MSNKINVQMKQFNGVDYDNIYPDGKNGMAGEIIATPNLRLTRVNATGPSGTVYKGEFIDSKWHIYVAEYGKYIIRGVKTTGGFDNIIKLTVDKCKQYEVFFADPILSKNSWEIIKGCSDEGLAESTWAIGDDKQITINGKVGNTTFSNLAINVFILGFNHNASKEGDNRIHFQIGNIRTIPVGLCDAKYNTDQTENGYFNWNPNNTNEGGWKSCYKRTTLYGNSGTPTSPPSGSLMAALPSDLRAVMKSVNKYTDNVGNGSGHVQSNVNITTDYLFDLAEFEVFGSKHYANQYEQNSQLQYDYYKAGNSKVAYNHSAVSTAVWWGLRSLCFNNSTYFCGVLKDGGYSMNYAYRCLGLRPGFCV